MPADARRAGDQALLLLAAAVVVACVGLGAPPRMEAVEGAPGWARLALESLLPLALVQVLTLLAAARLAFSGALLGTPGTRRPQLALAAVAVLGVVQLVGGWTAWPYGTAVALVQVTALLATAGAVLAAVRGASGAGRARVVLAFVAVVATLECGYGVVTTHVGDDTILGLAKVSSLGRVTGTFVMPSVLATLGAMGACAALALAAEAQRVGRLGAAAVWCAALVVCGAGVVLSLGRWMVVAAAAGLVVTMWCAGGVLRRDGRGGSGVALRLASVLVPAGGVAAALLVPALRERFEFLLPYLRGESGPVEPRFAGWLSAVDLFREHPLLGTGLGSFGRAIHLTQSVDAPEELWYAHCEPLNVLCDVGVVGLALVLAWMLGLAWRGRRARGPRDATAALLASGATGAAVAALVAGLGDFPTQFASVAIPFAACIALPAALAEREAEAGVDGAATSRLAYPARLALVGALGLCALLPLVALAARWRHVADGHAPGASDGERLLVLGEERLRGVSDAATPGEAELRAAEAADVLGAACEAEPYLDRAHLWRGLAHLTVLQLSTDPDESARRRRAALLALGDARAVSRGHADVNLQIGLLYLDLLGAEPNPHGPGDDTALDALREAGAILPQAFSRAWEEALAREMPPADLERIVPDRPHARRVWARHLRTLGRFDEADAILRELDREAVSDR